MSQDSAVQPQRWVILAGIAGVLVALLFLGDARGATASESQYCYGVNLGGYAQCVGSGRELNAVYGQGSQHSVCVWAAVYSNGEGPLGGTACSSGGGEGVYHATGYPVAGLWPVIKNNAAGSNTVYGLAFKP